MTNDLIPENITALIALLNESQWDYSSVGQALLPPVTGSELRKWITDGIPDRLMSRGGQGRAGRWEWLRKMIEVER